MRLLLAFFLIASPALAHHPFEGATETFSNFDGLLSGLAHPLLGIDHLLFLLSIGLVGGISLSGWAIPLLFSGLFGSLLALLSQSIFPFGEIVMGLSLIVSAFVCLGHLRPAWMIPLITSHGYVLGETIIGAEPTTLIMYLFGLFLVQGLLITLSVLLLRRYFINKKLIAFTLIGSGMVYSFTTLFGMS